MDSLNVLSLQNIQSQSPIDAPDHMIYQLKHYFPNNYEKQKAAIKHIQKTELDSLSIHVILEFYYIEGDMTELENLADSLLSSVNKEVLHWAKLYKLISQYKDKRINGHELTNGVMKIQSLSDEMTVWSMILHLHGVYSCGLCEALYKISSVVIPLIKKISNDYLRNAYLLHLNELLAGCDLNSSHIKKCRQRCEMVIHRKDIDLYYPYILSNFHHIMANSFLFESYEETLSYVERAENTLTYCTSSRTEIRRSFIQDTKDFNDSYWGQNLFSTPSSPSEMVHRYIVMNDKEQAKQLLKEIFLSDQGFTAYEEFYFGVATSSPQNLECAKEKFLAESNLFFLQLFSEKSLARYGMKNIAKS